jgi:UDP-2,4-diacetamido-2,4,6-trideoxy-beta-L-altropyranose hydrolase
MRCLTLAEGLREKRCKVLFICRELPGNLNHVITAQGFDLYRLPAAEARESTLDWNRHAVWLGVPWQQDAKETQGSLEGQSERFDWLVVDHYAIDGNWESALRPLVDKIMVIDDLADRQHDCDLLLDQNFYLDQPGRYDNRVSGHCQKLLGPGYALLRSEFHQARKLTRPRSGAVQNILVFFGGVDECNATAKALRAIGALDRVDFAVDVVVGAGNPHKHEIHELCKTLKNASFHCQVSNMAELMVRSDLAIGAGGTVTWERFCLGLPALVVSVAENQAHIAEDCAKAGCQLYLGYSAEVDESTLGAALRTVLQSPSLLVNMSTQAMQVVDGKGLSRVVQWLCPLLIKLREAGPDDCRAIYEWRNAEETRRHIFDKDIIPFEAHQQWFAKSLDNPDRIILVAEHDNTPAGVLRYDLNAERALVSVYLVPGPKPLGIGTQLIRAGSHWLRTRHPEITTIDAEILGENIASIKAFEKAGYRLNHLTYCKDLSYEEQ